MEGKELCKDCGEPIEKCICPDLAQAEYNMQSEAEHARQEAEAEEAALDQQREEEARYFNGEEPEDYEGEDCPY